MTESIVCKLFGNPQRIICLRAVPVFVIGHCGDIAPAVPYGRHSAEDRVIRIFHSLAKRVGFADDVAFVVIGVEGSVAIAIGFLDDIVLLIILEGHIVAAAIAVLPGYPAQRIVLIGGNLVVTCYLFHYVRP